MSPKASNIISVAVLVGTTLAMTQGTVAVAQADAAGDRQTVCAGQNIAGWIRVNDSWNPTTCGNPTSIVYNVWTIERYDNKPVGAQMRACYGAAPSGWAIVGSTWDPTACGHPTSISNNIMTIKRLN